MSDVFTTRPDLRGHFGMAGATHWLAAQTAMRMLELGGNAFDGAVAAGFVLQVAEPHLNGPLGEVPILLHTSQDRRTRVICGQGPAPRAATRDTFAELGLDHIPATGLLSAAIPGAFDAWMLLLRDYGSLPLETILEPAIFYAEKGVPVMPRLANAIETMSGWFQAEWPTSAQLYLANGTSPSPGELLCNTALAETWRLTLREAASAGKDRKARVDAARVVWKSGCVARKMIEFCANTCVRDVTGRKHRGLLTVEDVAGWSAHYEEPVHVEFCGHRVNKCGPWSQGPVLLQALRIIEVLGKDPLSDETGFVHNIVEAMKLCYADRSTYYGDPDFVKVPLETLLSRRYASCRALLVGERASHEWRPGDVPGFGFGIDYDAACNVTLDADELAAMGIGEPTVAKYTGAAQGDTCHINVVDRWGNLVAATPSGGWLSASPVIPELGFALGTRLQMMQLDAGAPDSLEPGKRPRTTLTPTLVETEDGIGYMACGSPGGDKQDQWQLAFLVRHLALGLSPQQAVDSPSFYSMHWPDSFFPHQAFPARLHVEGRISSSSCNALETAGHDLRVDEDWADNYLSASYRTRDGLTGAAASPRGQQAYAVGR